MPRKISKIAVDILKVIAITGLIAVAATSPYFVPNLMRNLNRRNRYRSNYSKKESEQAVRNLRRSKLIVLKEKDGKFFVELTAKGKRKFKEIRIDELKNKTPKDWDGLWRIIIFDIPEGKKLGREALRGKMKELGFCQLQKSVWVFPYECEKEIELLVELFDIDSFVNFIVAKRIKDDLRLKKRFGLS